jgi:RNA polymerase sigma-70 factor (ECF subfamily)
MTSTIETMQPSASHSIPYAEWSDEDLLLAYRSGSDRAAFEELVCRYERELFNYLRRYLGDADMAEDAFQATFLQVHMKCQYFEPGRAVRPWLYTVATNQAIDAQRRNRRHQITSLDRAFRAGDQDDEGGSLIELLGGDTPSPDEHIETAEVGEEVRLAVERLPESLKEVLILVYYQGLKYREAAEALEIPVGTVKSRLHAAIRRLQPSLTHLDIAAHG